MSFYTQLCLAYCVTLIGAASMVGGVTLLRASGTMSPVVGRKLMHMTTGPVYMLTWLLYPYDTAHPYLPRVLASTVPAAVALYMLLISLVSRDSLMSNRALVGTVSRSGDPTELRRGPFIYGILHSLTALIWWTDGAAGAAGLVVLCLGDGVADLVGRPYGRHKWPHNAAKSLEGSTAFVIASVPVLLFIIQVFQSQYIYMHINQVCVLPCYSCVYCMDLTLL